MGTFRSPVIATSRLVDYAVLSTAAATAASMPLANLALPQPTDKTRFTSVVSAISFDIDITLAKTITGATGVRLVAIPYNNASSTGTWTVIFATTQANLTSSPALTSTQNLWPCSGLEEWGVRIPSYLWIPTARTENWIRITINDTAPRKPDAATIGAYTTATYFDIGRLIVAQAYVPGDSGGNTGSNRTGVQFGVSDGLHEEVRRVISEGGQIFPRERPRPRSKTFTLRSNGPNAEAEFLTNVEPLRRRRGVSRDVFVMEDVTATTFIPDRLIYGLMGELEDVSLPDYNHYEVRFTVQEML
jgi:hypothetical protein